MHSTVIFKSGYFLLPLLSGFLFCFLQAPAVPKQPPSIAAAAEAFINTLDKEQQLLTLYPFGSEERYKFYFFPINDRKGLPLDQMNEKQRAAAFGMLRSCLSEATVKKVEEIIELENILRELESRPPNDRFRDPGKYHLAIFGVPADSTIWGWRFEGHHISFHFSAKNNALVSGTPGFLGANPAVVPHGPKKGREVLREEREKAFALLHSLSKEQMKLAVISETAPSDIVTGNSRKAMIDKPVGLPYSRMTPQQREKLLQLVQHYVQRYKKPLADKMLREVQDAGLDKLLFAWAGHTTWGPGHPHYYRIHGPTLIIEYDNTQNNANHVHTVVRDLLNDFGGDQLLEHYRSGHSHEH